MNLAQLLQFLVQNYYQIVFCYKSCDPFGERVIYIHAGIAPSLFLFKKKS